MHYLLFLAVAAISGSAMAFQGTMNSMLGKVIGLTQATLVVHVIGTVIAGLALALPILGKGDWSKLQDAPWYVYLGGVLSVAIVYGVAASITKLSVSNATTAIIAGQVLTALLIDHFGLFGNDRLAFTWIRGIGFVLLAIGVKLLLVKN